MRPVKVACARQKVDADGMSDMRVEVVDAGGRDSIRVTAFRICIGKHFKRLKVVFVCISSEKCLSCTAVQNVLITAFFF